MAKKRARWPKSVATELVKKAREAIVTSVQVFNNPQIEFRSELFIVMNIIAFRIADVAVQRLDFRANRA
jgi:hypothetical protein